MVSELFKIAFENIMHLFVLCLSDLQESIKTEKESGSPGMVPRVSFKL